MLGNRGAAKNYGHRKEKFQMERARWKPCIAILLLLATVGLGCGCGKKVTVSTLFLHTAAHVGDSAKGNIVLDIQGRAGTSLLSTGIGVAANVDAGIEKGKGSEINGNVQFSLLGFDLALPIQAYTVFGDQENTVYMANPATGAWGSMTKERGDSSDLVQGIVGLDYSALRDQFTLSDELEQYEGEECYHVSGQIKGTDMEEALQYLGEELLQVQMTEEALASLKADADFYFEKESQELIGLQFDLSDSDWEKIVDHSSYHGDASVTKALGKVATPSITECVLTVRVDSYGEYDFALPEDLQ